MNTYITATCFGTAANSYGRNTGKYYTSGQNWRIYQAENPTVTIKAAEGKIIVSVKISYASQNTGALTLNGSNIESDALIEVNANSITFSVGNTGTATNGQARITAIEVVYANAGTSNPETPDEPEVTEPEVTTPAEPEVTEPEGTTPAEPEVTTPAEPEVTEPEGTTPVEPETPDKPTTEAKDTIGVTAASGTLAEDKLTITWESNNFTVISHKNSSNDIRTSDTDHFRCYANSKFEVVGKNNNTITKIVITCTESKYVTPLVNSATAAGYSVTSDGDVVTIEVNAAKVEYTHSAQVRIKNIEIYY